ncbi:3-deoxy-manno-octulosonate cytidylyltransferase [Crocinitomicaceae bacterium]|nr:3-deoxy-manno-octulosonate cytidylyltransferase [Crocinitomicaceae bacterium]MDB3906126.1 3-deoxy-manno-octulosonate cytidylyltransferase [Crocinitomicaceae bacterium]
MKVIGIIPARYASTRFPGKPLVDLKGKPMIQRVYEGAAACASLDSVIVATDDQRIYDAVKAFGGNVEMTSESHPSGTDRCGELAAKYDADVIVNVQGDEPLVNPGQIDTLCSAFQDATVSIATLGHTQVSPDDLSDINRVKVVCDTNGNALYFSRSPIPSTERASEQVKASFPFMRHIGLYAYRKETLQELVELKPCALEQMEALEQLRWMYYGYEIRVIPTDIETPNIDSPEDLDQVMDAL